MELKDNVFYVAPNGVVLKAKDMDKAMGVVEVFGFIASSITNAFNTIKRAFVEVFNDIDFKKLIKEIGKARADAQRKLAMKKKLRQSWHVPINTMQSSQVMDRRPLFTNARSQL